MAEFKIGDRVQRPTDTNSNYGRVIAVTGKGDIVVRWYQAETKIHYRNTIFSKQMFPRPTGDVRYPPSGQSVLSRMTV